MLQPGPLNNYAALPEQWPPRYPNQPGLAAQEESPFDFSVVEATFRTARPARPLPQPANAAWWSTMLASVAGVFLCTMFVLVVGAIFMQQDAPKVSLPTLRDANQLPKNNRLSQQIVSGNYTFNINRTEKAAQFQSLHVAAVGKQLIALEISLESRAASGVVANQSWFSLQDSRGTKYGIVIFGKEPALPSLNDIPAGDIVTGWVTFEVPLESQNLTLEYRPFNQESLGFSVKI